MEETLKVIVLGAGCVGLSMALVLAKENEKNPFFLPLEIVIMADKFLDDTTTHGSGGLWEPYKIDGTPDDIVNKWGESTFKYFQYLYDNDATRQSAGVQLLKSIHLYDTVEELKIPTWKDIVYDFKVLENEELNNLESVVSEGAIFPRNKKYLSGYQFRTFTVEQNYYLKYLTSELKKRNVKFVNKTVDNITEFYEENEEDYYADVVVNCCGINGSSITEDTTPCFPTRGQVIRIKTPLLKDIWFFNGSYIIPNIDNVVCGGTAQVDDWNLEVSKKDTESIMNKLYDEFPAISDVPLENQWVGLRPSRVPLRLDSEIKYNKNSKRNILVSHCYGHGGSGVTLSYGCAEDVVINHILPFLSKKN